MARSHGRILSAIWSDAEFIALSEGAQRLYLFLLSQSDLSHAGLVPLRARKWAQKSPGLSAGSIADRLNELERARFAVVDFDTEEVLVRTFVKNDGVYKQPKVMVRLREDAGQIESPKLRAAFRAEILRLPLDELNDKPGGPHGDQPSTKQAVSAVVDTLRADFADVEEYPSEGVSDTPHVRAGAFPQPPSPVPHTQPPSPTPTPVASTAGAVAAPAKAVAVREKPAERFDEFWDAYGKKVARGAAEKAWAKALKKADADRIIAAAHDHAAWHQRNRTEDRFVPHPTTWLNEERWKDERSERQHAPVSRQQAETDALFDAAMQRAVERERNAG